MNGDFAAPSTGRTLKTRGAASSRRTMIGAARKVLSSRNPCSRLTTFSAVPWHCVNEPPCLVDRHYGLADLVERLGDPRQRHAPCQMREAAKFVQSHRKFCRVALSASSNAPWHTDLWKVSDQKSGPARRPMPA